MSQQKFTAKRFYIAASGATAVALALAATSVFEPSRELAAGQTPGASVPVLPSGEELKAAGDAPLPSVDRDPFKIGSAAPTAPGASVPNAANPPLPGVPQGGADDAKLASLRAQARELQAKLRKTPTSAAEDSELQAVAVQLAELQVQIQQLENGLGSFSDFRRQRDLERGIDPGAPDGFARFGAANRVPSALDRDQIGPNRRRALGESGLDSDALAGRVGGDSLTYGEADLLREQKEGLMQQYRQIQQTLRALQPGDEALATGLKEEQATLLAQLKDIDARLAKAPADSQFSRPDFPKGDDLGAIADRNKLPDFLNAREDANSIPARMSKVSEAARLLREAGLVQLANFADVEAPKLADPNYKETSLVPGAWTEASGLSEERYNPFQQISPDDVRKIADQVEGLKAKIESMSSQLDEFNAQLKLLTRNSAFMAGAVSENANLPGIAPAPVPEPAPTPAPTPDEAAPVAPEATEELPIPVENQLTPEEIEAANAAGAAPVM